MEKCIRVSGSQLVRYAKRWSSIATMMHKQETITEALRKRYVARCISLMYFKSAVKVCIGITVNVYVTIMIHSKNSCCNAKNIPVNLVH